MPTALTNEGRAFALANRETSIVARIALLADAGEARDWPDHHRDAATEACNGMAAKS